MLCRVVCEERKLVGGVLKNKALRRSSGEQDVVAEELPARRVAAALLRGGGYPGDAARRWTRALRGAVEGIRSRRSAPIDARGVTARLRIMKRKIMNANSIEKIEIKGHHTVKPVVHMLFRKRPWHGGVQ